MRTPLAPCCIAGLSLGIQASSFLHVNTHGPIRTRLLIIHIYLLIYLEKDVVFSFVKSKIALQWNL